MREATNKRAEALLSEAAKSADSLYCILIRFMKAPSHQQQCHKPWSSFFALTFTALLRSLQAFDLGRTSSAMARATVALLLLGLALAQAQTYTLDLDQPQKVRRNAAQQLERSWARICLTRFPLAVSRVQDSQAQVPAFKSTLGPVYCLQPSTLTPSPLVSRSVSSSAYTHPKCRQCNLRAPVERCLWLQRASSDAQHTACYSRVFQRLLRALRGLPPLLSQRLSSDGACGRRACHTTWCPTASRATTR